MFPIMLISEKGKTVELKIISVVARDLGIEVRECWIGDTQGTSECKTIPDNTAMRNAWHWAFIKIHRTLQYMDLT